MSETYNGWANVETWRVQLHLANDGQTAAYVSDMTELARSAIEEPIAALADWIRDLVESNVIPVCDSLENWQMFMTDTLQAALVRVDWRQLAERWLESTPPSEIPG